MWYKIDFEKLIQLLLPTFLRKRLIVATLQSIVAPVKSLYILFNSYREEKSRRLDFNGETQYLEKILNEEFSLSNEIDITDTSGSEKKLYLKRKSEVHQPVYMYPAGKGEHVVLSSPGEGNLTGDFTVNLPAKLNTGNSLDRVRRLVNYYKMAGKQYNIKIHG